MIYYIYHKYTHGSLNLSLALWRTFDIKPKHQKLHPKLTLSIIIFVVKVSKLAPTRRAFTFIPKLSHDLFVSVQEAREHAQGMKVVCNMPYQIIYQDALWQTTYAIVWLNFSFCFPFFLAYVSSFIFL